MRKERKLQQLKQTRDKIEKFLEQLEQEDSKENANSLPNLTDPDTRIVKDKDTKYVGVQGPVRVRSAGHFLCASSCRKVDDAENSVPGPLEDRRLSGEWSCNCR